MGGMSYSVLQWDNVLEGNKPIISDKIYLQRTGVAVWRGRYVQRYRETERHKL